MTDPKDWRIVPPEIEALLPPHRIEFHPDDPNLGRACLMCGFAVPQGVRYVHAEWCEARKAKKRAEEEAKRPEGWEVIWSSTCITLTKDPYEIHVPKYGTDVRLYRNDGDCICESSLYALRASGTHEKRIVDALAWFNSLGLSENKPSNG